MAEGTDKEKESAEFLQQVVDQNLTLSAYYPPGFS